MPLPVRVEYSKRLSSAKSAAETFRYLCDVPTSIPSHFPGLASFDEVRPDCFEWVFEKLKHSGYEFQIKLSTEKTVQDPYRLRLIGEKQKDYSAVNASWQVVPNGDASDIEFQITIEIEIPVPSLLKGMVTPLAQRELTKFFDRYAENIKKTLA